LVECIDVNKTLRTGAGPGRCETKVFYGLNLRIAAGERVGVIGPSGAGKTTLLRLLNRLVDADAGRVLFDGADVREQDVLALRRAAQLVPQKPYLFGATVRDNLVYGRRVSGRAARDDGDLRELLDDVDLSSLALDRPAAALSVGQQQRLCLARALSLEPRLLMLDETTASLEPPAARRVLDNIYRRTARAALTVLHVTHEVVKLHELDRVVVLAGGGVAEEGPPASVLKRPRAAVTAEFVRGLGW